MSKKLQNNLLLSISNALNEINQILGYEYFESTKIDNLSRKFLKMLPYSEKFLQQTRGASLEDVEKEEMDIDKGMKSAIKGIFHGIIIKNFNGNTFEEKFQNFLYYDGITHCRWINKTDYDNYYNTLFTLVKTINSDLEKLKLIHNLLEIKINSTSQGITKIFLKKDFFKESNYNELIIDLHIEIFKELAGIVENYIKLIYGIKANYTTQDLTKLNKKEFYYFWKELKTDQTLGIFIKPFPNTIYWNAGKHNGITKKIKTKEIEFRSNEGFVDISYKDFIPLVRELYACTITLTKIKLMIIFQNKTF